VSYTAPIAGTAEATNGTPGSYVFTVAINKGAGTQQVTNQLTLTITATAYDASGDNDAITSAKSAIQGAAYTTTQTATADEAAALSYIESVIAGLSTGTTNTVTKVSYTAPTAGTVEATSGTPGSYVFTVAINKGAGTQQETNQLTLTITATAYSMPPTLTSTSTSGTTHNSTTLNFTSDEAGTYYYLVYPAADTAPNATTVKAQGTAVAKGTGAATASANTVNVIDLAASTPYKAYVIVEDAALNLSAVSEIPFSTTVAPDSTPPILISTSASDTNHNSTTLNFTSDEVGTYYYLVYLAADSAPNAATIKAQGTAVAKGSAAATASANTVNVIDLTTSTPYKAYVIVEDAALNLSAVSEISFSTTAEPSVPATYALTVSVGTGGSVSGTASGSYSAGTSVNLVAAPINNNYSFDGWTTSGVSVSNTSSISFIMPARSVAITATFVLNSTQSTPTPVPTQAPTPQPTPTEPPADEPTSAPTPTPTPTSAPTQPPADEPTPTPIPTQPPITEPTSAPTPIPTQPPATEPSPTPIPTQPPATDPIGKAPIGNGQLSVEYTQSDDTVTLILPDDKINDIINNSVRLVTIDLSEATGATAATLPKEAAARLADADLAVGINLPYGSVTLSPEAAKSTAVQAVDSNIALEVKPVAVSSLNARQQAVVGNAPVYDISLTSNSQYITSFDGGLITIALPYTLKPGENASGITVWYLDDVGNIQKMNTMYDARNQTVIFTTDHLSKYFVTYEPSAASGGGSGVSNAGGSSGSIAEPVSPSPAAPAAPIIAPVAPAAVALPFIDVQTSNSYYGDVAYVYSRNIMGGVSTNAFGPNVPMSRAMLVTVMGRLAGANISGYTGAVSFGDVSVGQYYAPYVAWAQANAITGGVGNNIFAPNAPISRQDLAVILMNYVRYTGKPLSIKQTYSGFADSAEIAGYARASVEAIYKAGIIGGKPGNVFDPKGSATRAEVAAILRRYIQAVN
jgi:hypothetical protein